MVAADTEQTRRSVLRAARSAPRLTLEQIATRAGCHRDTARRHLNRAGLWPPGKRLLSHQQPQLTPAEAASVSHTADISPEYPAAATAEELTARLPACGWRLLDKFAAWCDPAVRSAAASHRDCSPPTLTRLATDPDSGVRASAARNEMSQPAVLAMLARDPGWGVVDTARFPRERRELARDPGRRIRAATAGNPTCPRRPLTRLAQDTSTTVRQAAAKNPSTPQRLLACLASDPAKSVRSAATVNPNAQHALLLRLADDREVDVRRAVASRLLGPLASTVSDETIDALAESRDYQIRQAARDAAYSRYSRRPRNQ